MSQINVYLNFEGNCREAMSFYQDVLGGELFLQTVGESPMKDQTPPAIHNLTMHSRLEKGGLVIMASDMSRGKLHDGNAMSLCMECDSEDEIRKVFSRLSEGGQVDEPLNDTFWGAIFGGLTDKFGKKWIFNYTKPQ